MEEWKDYHRYTVSSMGRVRSLYGKGDKMLRPYVDKDGYECLKLHNVSGSDTKKTRISVARMVALAFIPNPENKPTIDHINRIKTDNRVENLRWATTLEQNNNRHYKKMAKSGHRNIRARNNRYEVSIRQKYIGTFNILEEAIKARDQFMGSG